ncbi:MAG: SAM-dependent chlorinase/fluorinase [Actinomycetota bacterium]|nr:SAM-dependent chlorinase/fluorinase [Actinomycetota bacterium]
MADGPATVYFLSDFGTDDEFAGVVRAVLQRMAGGVAVVDLTHGIPPYDVAAGAAALVRAVPYLGSGVVLAVVDPGVGGARRGVAIEIAGQPPGCPLAMVGPDNGLLLPACQERGGISRAVTLDRSRIAPSTIAPSTIAPSTAPCGACHARPAGATFDGRDLFAPAAAMLCRGADLVSLGDEIPVAGLTSLPPPPETSWVDGVLDTHVAWVDRFGNVELATGMPPGGSGRWHLVRGDVEVPVVEVRAFADLGSGELGLLVDSCAKLALVLDQDSAAEALSLRTGDSVRLVSEPVGTKSTQ